MGVSLYLLIGLNGGTRKMKQRYIDIDRKLFPLLPENEEDLERIKKKTPKAGNISEYIQRNAHYPVYQNTDVTYYDEAICMHRLTICQKRKNSFLWSIMQSKMIRHGISFRMCL
jgi:hypothetical protein